jgi:ArsR family transcriptional regulator
MDITTTEPRVFDRMSALGDLARGRLLLLLEQGEFTVSELVQVSQLPQSTVSRHLKILADDEWVTSRASGTSRYYRMAAFLEPTARELWRLVRPDVAAAGLAEEDDERARAVLLERRGRSREFFSGVAGRWDKVREELFGNDSETFPLFGLLDPAATVGDLGAGTGHFAARVAPFVERVVAVDASEEMLQAARDRLGGAPNVDLRCGNLEKLPIEDGELDVAVLLLVLHYLVEPQAVLKEVARTLKPGGRVVIVDMRRHSREGYQEEMGHVWPGFDESDLADWHRDAGLSNFAYRPLPPRPEASGPLLFITSATRMKLDHSDEVSTLT